jgi:hypothetical protein
MMKSLRALLVGVVMAPASIAFAQQEGLVNVNIELVRNEIAKDINVNVSQIPVTVQAPIGVAATVCNVQASVLATAAKQGKADCKAQNTSTALNEIVQRQVTAQR